MAQGVSMDQTNVGLLEHRLRRVPETCGDDIEVMFLERRWPRRSTAFQMIIYLLASWGFVSLWLQTYQRMFLSRPSSSLSLSTTHTQTPQPFDVYHPETLPEGMTLCDCGTTTAEARARACVYDTLATAWLPPACRDPALTTDFDAAGDGPNGTWRYYADAGGTQPLAVEALGALGDTGVRFWASRRWHRAHCLFYWQKLFRMRETGVVMEDRFHRWSHVQHCSRLLLNPLIDLDILVDVPVTLNSSVYAGRKEEHIHEQGEDLEDNADGQDAVGIDFS